MHHVILGDTNLPAMIALPTPLPSSAWCVMIFLPRDQNRGEQLLQWMILTGPSHQKYQLGLHGLCRGTKDISAPQSGTMSSGRSKSYVVQRTVCTNQAAFVKVSHFANNSSNPACAKASCASTNKLSQSTEKLAFS
jgi:hypothetical protein